MAVDDAQIKRAYQKLNYTPQQIDELKACMHPQTGPLYFIKNFMYIQHPTQGRQKLQLYEFQYGLLESYHKYRKSVNLISRQMGKCVTGDTNIRIRNKITGEIQTITIEEFHTLASQTHK